MSDREQVVDSGSSTSDHIRAIAERRDRAAFTLLFARFAPKVKAFLIRRGHAPQPAEELMQEAMLTVWRKAERFDPTLGSGEAWIFTIARNVAIDAQRRDRGKPLVGLDLAPEPVDPGSTDLDLISGQEASLVRSALGALPVEQLEVVRLSFFDDRPHGEIAEALGLPLGTVKSRLRLAMKRLRSVLEGSR